MKRIPKHVRFILSVYILGLVIFFLLRLLFLVSSFEQYQCLPKENSAELLVKSLGMGVRFDTVVSGYILIVPLVLLTVISLFRIQKNWLYKFVSILISGLYIIAFLIVCLDIPYFVAFGSRLNTAMAGRLVNNSSFILGMFFQEIKFSWVLLPFIIVAFVFYKSTQIFRNKILTIDQDFENSMSKSSYYLSTSLLSILLLGLMLLGIRGRIAEKSPILVSTAYFSNYSFPNQLGLNPVFTLVRSYLDDFDKTNHIIKYMDGEKAILAAQKLLNRNNPANIGYPLSKKVQGSPNAIKPNIVLIIMESMSANKMGYFESYKPNTPNLDKLANQSLIFVNFYSAGIHTYNGIYGALFGQPALKTRHPMEQVELSKMGGLATSLKAHGYQTTYFTNHDEEFDGVAGFLKFNDFSTIVSEKDYPSEKVLSALGVPDDYMFEFSITKLNEMASQGKPFLATYMTASDHGPYIFPEYYKRKYPIGVTEDQEITRYADWSIGKFMESASKQSWFENTLFVFVADHGTMLDPTYELATTMTHIPLIIYSPKIAKYERLAQFGSQIDVFPTIMGITGLSYTNNSLGIDLLKETRPYAYFSADDRYGVISEDWYFIIRDDKYKSLYKYRRHDRNNWIADPTLQEVSNDMQKYAETMFQASQWMIDNKKTYTK